MKYYAEIWATGRPTGRITDDPPRFEGGEVDDGHSLLGEFASMEEAQQYFNEVTDFSDEGYLNWL